MRLQVCSLKCPHTNYGMSYIGNDQNLKTFLKAKRPFAGEFFFIKIIKINIFFIIKFRLIYNKFHIHFIRRNNIFFIYTQNNIDYLYLNIF